MKTVLAGWQTNGIFVAQTGMPFNVTTSNDYTNTGRSNQRPNLVGVPSANCDSGHLTNCIDMTAFALPSNYAWGNFGRNVLRGPGFWNLDFSLFKDFAVSERFKVQFRSEFFNFTNTPQFANPSVALPGLSSGNLSYASVNPGSFGSITSTIHDNREIQMALKVIF